MVGQGTQGTSDFHVSAPSPQSRAGGAERNPERVRRGLLQAHRPQSRRKGLRLGRLPAVRFAANRSARRSGGDGECPAARHGLPCKPRCPAKCRTVASPHPRRWARHRGYDAGRRATAFRCGDPWNAGAPATVRWRARFKTNMRGTTLVAVVPLTAQHEVDKKLADKTAYRAPHCRAPSATLRYITFSRVRILTL